MTRPSSANLTSSNIRKAVIAAVLASLILPGWGPLSSAIYDKWEFDSDGNGIDDMLDALIAQGDEGPWTVDIHYSRSAVANDETVLSVQHGVDHMYRYNNWPTDILAIIDIDNVYGIADMLDVYGVELLPEPPVDDLPDVTEATDASVHAVRVREYPLVADGYDHNDAAFEDRNLTGAGVVIAVIDGGIDNTHVALDDMDDNLLTDDPKLVQRPDGSGGTLYGGVNLTGDLQHEYCVDPIDHSPYGHGTQAAGLALGTSGGVGMPGMAPGARLVDIAVNFPVGGPDLIAGAYHMAFDWILDYNKGSSCYLNPGTETIDVLSISRGLSGGNPHRGYAERLTELVRSGITVVMSAGNNQQGWNAGLNNQFEGGIVVANVNINFSVNRADDELHWSSVHGPRSLPDGDIDQNDELIPHVAAPGEYVLAPAPNTATGYVPFRGTSSAAPHVAGIAALMLEANRLLRPIDQGSLEAMGDEGAVPIRDILIRTAQIKTAVEQGPLPGSPEPLENEPGMFGEAWNAGWGYGLVDAYNATVMAENYQP